MRAISKNDQNRITGKNENIPFPELNRYYSTRTFLLNRPKTNQARPIWTNLYKKRFKVLTKGEGVDNSGIRTKKCFKVFRIVITSIKEKVVENV